MIRRWRREYKQKSGDFGNPRALSPEQQEIRKLKKELRDAQLERDTFKKAVSIFSKSGRYDLYQSRQTVKLPHCDYRFSR